MKLKIYLLLLIAFVSIQTIEAYTDQETLQLIKEHYKQVLIDGGRTSADIGKILLKQEPEKIVSDQVTVDVQQRYPSNIQVCEDLMNTLNKDGSWSDIDYANDDHSGWDPKRHADRTLMLAKLYANKNISSDLKNRVTDALHQIINCWFHKNLKCGNWWYNEVGIPKTLGEAFLLFEDGMTETELSCAVNIVMSHSQIPNRFTGQNLVWVTGNVLIRALLENDYDLAKKCRDIIGNEIVTTRKEGIQPDWSFHQHGPLQQFGNYGLSYLMSMSLYSDIFRDSSLAFDEEKISILTHFLNDGYRWTLWKGFFDVNSLTRQLYRCAQRDKAMGVAFSAALMREADNGICEDVYRNIYKENFSSDKINQLIGNKYFWNSDCAFHRRQDWMCSLRESSNRTKATEVTNNENALGYNMGQGVLFVYSRGDEYYNDMPFWNWNFLPGVTSFSNEKELKPNAKVRNTAGFVGGVTDGMYGLSALTIERNDLHANKYWIMEDDFILCLGDSITSKRTDCDVITTVDQRAKITDFQYLHKKHWLNVKNSCKTKSSFFHHDNRGYIFLDDNRLISQSALCRGSWGDFMPIYSKDSLEKEMITLAVNHGKAPQNASYRYLILPNVDNQTTQDFDVKRINIQTKQGLKTISVDKNHFYIIAYKPFEIQLSSHLNISSSQSGLFLITLKNGQIQMSYSDPLQRDNTVVLRINKTIRYLDLKKKNLGESHTVQLSN